MKYYVRRDVSTALFETAVGEYLSVLAAGQRMEEHVSYVERYKEVWGMQTPKDERTAQEIIDDTFKRHGLTIKKAD